MAYKCRICGFNDVENPGDVCELCAIGEDPYAAAVNPGYGGGAETAGTGASSNRKILLGDPEPAASPVSSGKRRRVLLNSSAPTAVDPYGNQLQPQDEPSDVQVYRPGQAPLPQTQAAPAQPAASGKAGQAVKGPITSGITKNISSDVQKYSFLRRWFRALFSGVPFTLDGDITMFQVFPDYSGTALNAQGNVCDQVIVYGKLKNGSIAENNDIEVYGRRDANNNIVATTIKNKASGTTVTPERTLGVAAVWVITVLLFVLVWAVVGSLGPLGVMWAVILLLCLTNLPAVLKVLSVLFGAIFTLFRKL
ncbi:hypothetical protein [Dysosmobacter sp.]|uniref:hypothetical protein n=1 Tax=Dysosmobacter sp. TaxID=2591382 RepID=UPI002A8D5510|nr:hypothetical protein [Dysosmobacter sp.]MDY3281375.1 hypothetical protein [Dysosmobacter sp.]